MGFLSRIKDLANRHRAEEVVPESARKVFAHYMVGHCRIESAISGI